MVVESGCLLKKLIKSIKIKKEYVLKKMMSQNQKSISSCNVAQKRKLEEEISSESSFSDNNATILEDISR